MWNTTASENTLRLDNDADNCIFKEFSISKIFNNKYNFTITSTIESYLDTILELSRDYKTFNVKYYPTIPNCYKLLLTLDKEKTPEHKILELLLLIQYSEKPEHQNNLKEPIIRLYNFFGFSNLNKPLKIEPFHHTVTDTISNSHVSQSGFFSDSEDEKQEIDELTTGTASNNFCRIL